MATYTPPFYSKFGKQYADLWKKGFETNNKVSLVTKTGFGLKLTLDGNLGKEDIQGVQKVEYTDKSWGKADGELDTETGKAWGSATFKKLIDGGEVSVHGGFDPKSKDKLHKAKGGVKAEVQYKKDIFAVSGRLSAGYATKADKSVATDPSARIEADAAVGFDGLSVGASLAGSLGDAEVNDGNDLDVNVACQYTNKDFTAAVTTQKMSDVLKFSWYHKVGKDIEWGAEVVSDEFGRIKADRPRTLSFASKYQVNTDTSVKFRANHFGEVAAGVEQVLHDPRLKVRAGATFTAQGTKSFKAEKFGLGLTFGDF